MLAHEFTHALVRTLAARSVPTWLNEGLATALEADSTRLGARRACAQRRRRCRSTALRTSFGRLTGAQAQLAYATSALAVAAAARRSRRLRDRQPAARSRRRRRLRRGVPASHPAAVLPAVVMAATRPHREPHGQHPATRPRSGHARATSTPRIGAAIDELQQLLGDPRERCRGGARAAQPRRVVPLRRPRPTSSASRTRPTKSSAILKISATHQAAGDSVRRRHLARRPRQRDPRRHHASICAR